MFQKSWMSILAGSIGVFLVAANAVVAQQMSFAVYNDVSGGETIYNYGSAEDNSWGCSHWGYSTTARLNSPSGRNSSGTSGGLAASTALAFANDSGNWSAVTQGVYNCSCIYGSQAGFGGGQSFYAGRFYGRYWNYGVLCPDGQRRAYLADSCLHRCMTAQVCSWADAPYLWDVGVNLTIAGWGVCHHSYQGSNSRGLCVGPP